MTRVYDFRSDTVTKPTPEMREAMAKAVVGDDVLGDDPTVQELEAEFASMLGKEAAIFCPSGTMCNVIAACVWCKPGDEIYMEESTHTFRYEGGAAARFAGAQIYTFARPSGVPEVDDVVSRLRSDDPHEPRSRLFVLENTHNVAGGRPVPVERVRELADAAHERGLKMHVDGARLFNAATALGVSVAELAEPADSVMCCLSKGLGAPIGSCLAGSLNFIYEAQRVRKALGGGMRQVGVLAATALIALREGSQRLGEDHERAKRLAAGIADIPGISCDEPATNMVVVHLPEQVDTAAFRQALWDRGLQCFDPKPHRLRLVVHRDLDDEDVAGALAVLRGTAEGCGL